MCKKKTGIKPVKTITKRIKQVSKLTQALSKGGDEKT
jgi:hypothetical protein